MRAAVLREVRQKMAIEEVSIAKPRGREVLVRVAAVGLCHSDLHIYEGDLPENLPVVLGHEVAGIVEQIGPDVRTVRPGDHVIISLTFNCGHCRHCHGGHPNRCMTPEAVRGADEPPRVAHGGDRVGQFMNIGGFAEQILVHDSGCIAIRRDMPLDRACLISCGVSTGFGAASRSAGVQPGDTVAVIGCGGVGLAAVNGAFVAGASRIFAIDRLPNKLEMARRFGATDLVCTADGDVVERVLAATGGIGVDHAIEAIGLKQTIEAAYNMVGKGGTATVVGVARPDVRIELAAYTLLREKRLQGSMMGGVRIATDMPYYVELYLQGRLRLDELISQRRPLAQINEAFDDLRRGEIARSVIVFDS